MSNRVVTDALYVYADGREVCRKDTEAGRALYRQRTVQMVRRQMGRCCLEGFAPMCHGFLRESEATFEHEDGRGAGRRDDRIVKNGKPINGAAHALCNQWKGSRRVRYNER